MRIAVLLIFCLASVWLQAQPLVKGTQALVKQAAGSGAEKSIQKSGSILDELDRLYTSGEQMKVQALWKQRVEAARVRQHRAAEWESQRGVPERMRILRSYIHPTEPQQLPRLSHPFTGQEFTFSRQYQAVMAEFSELRKNFEVYTFFSVSPVQFPDEKKRVIGTEWHGLLIKLQKLQQVYPNDKPLNAALEYVQFALGEINPMMKGAFAKPQPRTGRRFQKEEFVFDEMWFSQINRMAWPPRQAELPENLNVIVVNDDPTVFHQYSLWKSQGLFKNWNFTFYDTAEAAVKEIAADKKYQLLITDWTVANSSVLESVRQLRAGGHTIPVIVCSSYTADQINAQQMFNQGFDGFVSWASVSASGPEYLTERLKQYFFYKDYYKW